MSVFFFVLVLNLPSSNNMSVQGLSPQWCTVCPDLRFVVQNHVTVFYPHFSFRSGLGDNPKGTFSTPSPSHFSNPDR